MIRNKLRLAAMVAASMITAVECRAGEVLDRIVATVNNHVILQSDWNMALSYQAFLQDRRVRSFSAEECKAALDHLIDAELIRQQIVSSDFVRASPDDVERRIQQIRQEKAPSSTEGYWTDTLAKFGLSENDLKEKVRNEIDQMRAIEVRLRPGVQVDERSVEVYYNEKFLPKLRQTGSKDVSLAEVAPQIKELLAQEKISEFLISWLHTLRNESTIHTHLEGIPLGGGGS